MSSFVHSFPIGKYDRKLFFTLALTTSRFTHLKAGAEKHFIMKVWTKSLRCSAQRRASALRLALLTAPETPLRPINTLMSRGKASEKVYTLASHVFPDANVTDIEIQRMRGGSSNRVLGIAVRTSSPNGLIQEVKNGLHRSLAVFGF